MSNTHTVTRKCFIETKTWCVWWLILTKSARKWIHVSQTQAYYCSNYLYLPKWQSYLCLTLFMCAAGIRLVKKCSKLVVLYALFGHRKNCFSPCCTKKAETCRERIWKASRMCSQDDEAVGGPAPTSLIHSCESWEWRGGVCVEGRDGSSVGKNRRAANHWQEGTERSLITALMLLYSSSSSDSFRYLNWFHRGNSDGSQYEVERWQ